MRTTLTLRQYDSVPSGMSKIITLENSENVLAAIHYSWVVMLQNVIFPIFGGALLGVLVIGIGLPGIVFLGLIAFLILMSLIGLVNDILYRKKTGFVATDQRVVKSYAGLLTRSTDEIRMEDIENIKTRETGALIFFINNKVIVSSPSEKLKIPTVDAKELAKKIRRVKNTQQRVQPAGEHDSQPPGASPAHGDPQQRSTQVRQQQRDYRKQQQGGQTQQQRRSQGNSNQPGRTSGKQKSQQSGRVGGPNSGGARGRSTDQKENDRNRSGNRTDQGQRCPNCRRQNEPGATVCSFCDESLRG